MEQWRRITHEATGISCLIGRLTWRQKPLVAAMIAETFSPLAELTSHPGSAKKEPTGAETARALRASVDAMDDAILRPIFQHKVSDVQGLPGVTAGEQLLDEAPDMRFIIWMMSQLVAEASLTDAEGKVSDSPSMSSSAPTVASDSPAPSTKPEGGLTRSTALEMTAGKVSSSQVA